MTKTKTKFLLGCGYVDGDMLHCEGSYLLENHSNCTRTMCVDCVVVVIVERPGLFLGGHACYYLSPDCWEPEFL